MRHWTRARLNTLCGNCPTVVKQGEPLLEMGSQGRGWRVVRCPACADEPVPANIEDLPTDTRTIGPRFAERIDSIRSIGRDWKHSQANEDRR